LSKTIDRDHIVWAYRQLLGREPATPAAVGRHLRQTLQGLHDIFLCADGYPAQARRRGNGQRPPDCEVFSNTAAGPVYTSHSVVVRALR